MWHLQDIFVLPYINAFIHLYHGKLKMTEPFIHPSVAPIVLNSLQKAVLYSLYGKTKDASNNIVYIDWSASKYLVSKAQSDNQESKIKHLFLKNGLNGWKIENCVCYFLFFHVRFLCIYWVSSPSSCILGSSHFTLSFSFLFTSESYPLSLYWHPLVLKAATPSQCVVDQVGWV